MMAKKKPFLIVTCAAVVITAACIIYLSGKNSSSDLEQEATGEQTTAALAAYLNDSRVELSKNKGAVYELRLLIDDFPAGKQVTSLDADIRIPNMFDVDGIEPNETNLQAGFITFQLVEGGITLQVRNDGNSAISFSNRDNGKELAKLKLKLNRELTYEMNEEIKVNKLEIGYSDKRTEAYDVSGAAAQASYAPPAAAIGKLPPNGNPVVAHKFGADPYALVFEDRVYLYNTNDAFEYSSDGSVKDNSYSSINKLSIISSDDLVNWTDHGAVQAAGRDGAAKWATQSWAPAAAHKVIDGKDKFFLYFANNASGIGVLSSDSPVGPWVDPIGKPLISRSMPGVEDVTWLFDPAVLVDDDGKAYIYYGGGIPEGKHEMPNTARVMQLGDDMISVVGEASVIPAPYMFESSGINKVDGLYYYTYCSNFIEGVRPDGPPPGEIAYMVSDNPMGPWTYKGTILKNPGHFFGVGGNNHQAIFQFQESWYIVYHAQTLSKAMGVPKGYRSTHLNQVFFNEDGTIESIDANMRGVEAVKSLNPYKRTEAETMAWNAGIKVESVPALGESGSTGLAVTDIDNGDWIAVAGADFGEGAASFTAWIAAEEGGKLELRLDSPEGKLVGALDVPSTIGREQWTELTTWVSGVKGSHHLYFVFKGKPDQKLFVLDAWQFNR